MPTLQVGSISAAGSRPNGARAIGQPLDLRRFDPAQPVRTAVGSHRIRRLVGGYRLAVPEVAELGTDVVGVLERDRWVLRRRRRGDNGVTGIVGDSRGRIAIPSGVRHCLGLGPWVGVSVLAGSDAVVVWATSRLDIDLEVNP